MKVLVLKDASANFTGALLPHADKHNLVIAHLTSL